MCTDLTLPHLDVSSPSADKSADLCVCVYIFLVMHIRVCCRPAHTTAHAVAGRREVRDSNLLELCQ